MGATQHEAIKDHGHGFVTATIVDPFGNILGIMFNPHYLEILSSIAELNSRALSKQPCGLHSPYLSRKREKSGGTGHRCTYLTQTGSNDEKSPRIGAPVSAELRKSRKLAG